MGRVEQVEGKGKLLEWTDPHPDHGGVTHWIDENGEWNSDGGGALPNFERQMSEAAYVERCLVPAALSGLNPEGVRELVEAARAIDWELTALSNNGDVSRRNHRRLRAALAALEVES